MNFISGCIIKNKKKVIILFFAIAVICTFMLPFVSVNYNMVDYLPSDAQSTAALSIMQDEFDGDIPNARVMLEDVTLTQAKQYKEQISGIEGVSSVVWLDDVVNLKEPIEMADAAVAENYYKDNTALFSVTINEGYEVSATDAIYDLIGENNALAGEAVNMATMQKMSVVESLKAFAILVPLIIIILLLSTSSWIEPLLFLLTIGISVLINMGSNIFLGEISFMTLSISPILQMAVSLDYAIFLLHRFEAYRKQTADLNEAMRLAMKQAFPAIFASAATTLFGFVALLFMKFRIGSDLGLNLVKGIVLSYLSVMLFLPAFTLIAYKLIDKTKHKKIIPDFKGIGKHLIKIRIPCLIAVLIIILPCFLAQNKTAFVYGSGAASESSRGGQDEIKISDKFGKSTSVVLLVPKGDIAKEYSLSNELGKIPHIFDVISYSKTVGAEIPSEYLDKSITKQFYSPNYARIILNTDTEEEGKEAFEVVEAVHNKTAEYYENFFSCGQSVNLYDMKNVVTKDTGTVNIIAVIAIALVLMFTFKSLTIPLLLLFTIKSAIWINLSAAYFAGNALCYIGYLVINTVQLGATVDYAILLTDSYMKNRRELVKKDAVKKTLDKNFISILISAVILASAGFCLALTSTNPIVAELGLLLGRGTLLSMAMVLFVLPALLLIFDKVIEHTTLKTKFYKENQK